jgi:hypothetical protein
MMQIKWFFKSRQWFFQNIFMSYIVEIKCLKYFKIRDFKILLAFLLNMMFDNEMLSLN